MKNLDDVEQLIYKSILESNHFKEHESYFYSTILRMMIEQGGGLQEYMRIYSPYFDVMDMEIYFRDWIVEKYGTDSYNSLVKYILGENDDVEY